MVKATISKLKIDKEGFNDLESREIIKKLIRKYKLELKFIDIEDINYWKNDYDTMVFSIKKTKMLEFGKFINEIRPDEFDFVKNIVRLWWD